MQTSFHNELRQFMTVGLSSLRAVSRLPVTLVLVMSIMLAMALLPSLVAFNFGDENRLVRDGALAFYCVGGMVLAGTVSAALAYGETATGVSSLLLCKPVSRTVLFLGRYAGLAGMMLCFSSVATIGTLLAERAGRSAVGFDGRIVALFVVALALPLIYAAGVNFRYRRSFTEHVMRALPISLLATLLLTAWLHPGGGWCRFGEFMDWRILPAGILIALALLLFAALASALTVRLALPTAICLYGLILGAGALADYLAARIFPGGLAVGLIGILPAWQDFWMVDALAGNGIIGADYMVVAMAYAILYIAATLCFGLALFRQWEP